MRLAVPRGLPGDGSTAASPLSSVGPRSGPLGIRELEALDPDRAPARVEAQRVAALAEAAREAAARDLALHADGKLGLDGVSRGLDREVRVRIHRDLDAASRCLERAPVRVALRERSFDPAA